ncbi:uncharacterized protein VTP21DRAFT_6827 [Calcarisporiella thermophila]|uniref:uncharacterized protein n=1 Tax=Calcarisporiella thermophila TaxID=911321 RepID=UPI0037438AC4
MKKKVLLMGKSGSGKTSMRSIIFSNYVAKDTRRLGPTMDIEHSHVRFLNNLVLNLWDCGGQDHFMENYLLNQRDQIFRNVEVLIYVFDVENGDQREVEKDMDYYQGCLEAIMNNSKDAKIFCLVHKMDLIPEEQRQQTFEQRYQELKTRSEPLRITAFATSIWDETLYMAWSQIINSLIPNIGLFVRHLDHFCALAGADEVILFERKTFLEVAHSSRKSHPDPHRFEKISNIVKQFKFSCSKIGTSFDSLTIRRKPFSVYIDVLTQHTYVMVVLSDPKILPGAMTVNLSVAKKHFENLEMLGR